MMRKVGVESGYVVWILTNLAAYGVELFGLR